jgi:AraC-like DNA-binding protein
MQRIRNSKPELLRVRYALAFFRALEAKGFDGRSMWQSAGLGANVLDDPEAWMPLEDLCKFLKLAVDETEYRALGLDAGIRPRRMHSEFSLKVLLRPSLYEALSSICRMSGREDTSARWRLVRDGPDYWMQCRRMHGHTEGIRQIELFRYACVLEIVRFVAGDHWLPRRLDLQSKRFDTEPDPGYFGACDVRFGMPHLQLSIPPLLLGRTLTNIPNAPMSNPHFTQSLDSFVNTLVEVARYQALSGRARLEDTARALGLSTRTLQRRLANEGITFSRLLLAVRIDTAKEWLASDLTSVTEISRRLGYTKSTNFSRAFHKVCGVGPTEYRRLIISERS